MKNQTVQPEADKDAVAEEYFWQSEKSLEYKGIAEDLPLSNVPATEVVYKFLNPQGKTILDYGCFQGDSTKRVLDHGAAKVVGVDINHRVIEIAQTRFDGDPRLSFQVIDGDTDIAIPAGEEGFDAASVTFVHPTIPNIEIIGDMMQRLFKAIKPGGHAVFLGLHPNSFTGEHQFHNYGHHLPESGTYQDGEEFPNQLRKNDGTVLEFNDYCWTEETMRAQMLAAGFTSVEVISVVRGQVGEANEVLDNSIEQIKSEKGVDFSQAPEFSVPLYQVFIARK